MLAERAKDRTNEWRRFVREIEVISLKATRKMHLKKCRLLISSAANNYLTLLANLSIQAKSVDPEQTGHIGAV